MVVKEKLEKHGLHPSIVNLGEIDLEEKGISVAKQKEVNSDLQTAGFEIIDDRKSRIIEKIKNVAISLVHYLDESPKKKHSEIISSSLHYDYPYLSNLFSEVEGITIEQFIIVQKVEKIKEYLVYDELTLSEIADRMGYSSVAHLSSQFKKVTGLPPSHFKNIGINQRKSLDEVGKG